MTSQQTVMSAAVVDLEPLGGALARRMRDIAAAARRLDAFSAADRDRASSRPQRDDVREFVLRALRIAADRDNNAILRAVAAGSRDTTAIAQVTGRPRLALWESVNDLVQVGLLERETAADSAHLTDAGSGILAVTDLLVLTGDVQ